MTQTMEAKTSFRGCVLIKKEGEEIMSRATGYADLANEIPNRIDTRFQTASAGKAFVAVGILQLIEQGKLAFTDTLGSLLDYDLGNVDLSVTVKELLTHTSGVPDYFDESVMEDYEELWIDVPNYRIRSNADLLPLFIHKPMMYERGARFQYNNTGYVLLAMVIEAVTKMEFDQYLEKHIFKPCGMKRTGYFELDCLPDGCANSYIYDEIKQRYRTNIFSIDAKGTGAGGAYTTVEDIVCFWDGLLHNQLLSKEMVKEMCSLQASEEEEGCYGYGVWLKENNDDTYSPYFMGCDPGVSFLSLYDNTNDTISILVSNYGDPVFEEYRNINENNK